MSETVFTKIKRVTAVMAGEGISKDSKNASQGYAFRGIDSVYNALSRVLSDIGLVIVPSYSIIKDEWRESKTGGWLHYVGVQGDYAIYSADDGSSVSASFTGEAMDSGDKATNKAMSAAYKYLCLQLFCIPTEGDNDADAQTHEVKAPPKELTPQEARAFMLSIGFETEAAIAWKKDYEANTGLRFLEIITKAKQSNVKNAQALADFAGLITGNEE